MVKILLNSIISKLNAKFVTIYVLKKLNTPMSTSEYMRLKLSNLPKSLAQNYNLEEKSTRDRYVCVEINWGCMVSRK